MARFRVGKRHLASVLALLAPTLVGTTGLSSNFEDRVVAAHNRERDALGIAPMRWDPRLAASAQTWANHLAATRSFRHAGSQQLGDQGENLWMGTTGYFSVEAMVDGWLLEKRQFKQGRFPDNSRTGDYRDVAHYTQIVWRETGSVGCARASNGEHDFLVCRYAEAGNYIGEVPY